MGQEINIKTVADTEQAQKNVQELNEEFDLTKEAVTGLTASIDKMTGGLITSMKGVAKSTKGAIMGMKTLKGAIIATGIGALVVVVGTLVSYFTNTQRGADKVDIVFKALGATVDVLIDRVSQFGEGLFQIISGDFSAGLETLTGSFKGVVDEIKNEATAAAELERALKALEDREIEFIQVQAEKEKAIAAARLAAEDATLSDKERADALREGIRLETEIADQQIKFAKERARIITEQVALGESSRDDIREQAEAQANVLRLETQRDTALKSIQTRLNAFTKSTKENTKATLENIEAKRIEAQGFDLGSDQDIELQKNEMLNTKLAEQNAKFLAEDAARKQKNADDELIIEENKAKTKIALERNIFNIAGNLAKQGSKEAKGIAVAQVLFETYKGIQGAFAAATTNPVTGAFPAYPFIQAAAAASFGFANVKRILATKTSGGSPGGGQVSTTAPRASIGNTEGSAVPNIDSINQGVGGQQNSRFNNIKTYVVQEDLQDQAALNQRLNDLQKA